MPGMNGMELTRILKEKDAGKAHVIMISGTDMGIPTKAR